jgi:hypothetical protein
MLRAYEGKISILLWGMGESPVLAIGLYLIGTQSFNANLAPRLHCPSSLVIDMLPLRLSEMLNSSLSELVPLILEAHARCTDE